MLSVNLIQRHFEGKRFDALMDALAANGMELPLSLRIRLAQAPASAAALGLRRVIELTYGPTGLSREMTRFLLDSQEPNGSFGNDPLATSAAAATLGLLRAEQPAATTEPGVELARERALAALAAMQDEAGLFRDAMGDRTQQDRALTSAFVLFLLARDEAFRTAVRLADTLDWFEQHRDQLDADTRRLWTMAGIDHAPHHSPTSPAVKAIAA